MKKLLILPFLLLFFSCEEEGKFTQNVLQETPISPIAQLLYTGNFDPTSGINVSGEAKILSENNKYKLELSNFQLATVQI